MKISENTHFLYIMTSSNSLEIRFLQDIAHCSLLLSFHKGLAHDKQTIVADIPKADLVSCFNFFDDFNVVSSSDIYEHIKTLDCENLFIVASCHGDLYGITAKTLIRPHDLTESIKQNPHIVNCVAMFGQCYAGIFNHMDLICEGKHIVYIGATDMRKGISSLQTWKLNDTNKWEWCANIFVLHLARWFNSPVDVDNDGKFTIVDMYKYVSYNTNKKTEDIEKEEAKRYLDERIKAEIGKLPADIELGSEMKMLDEKAVKDLDYMIPHQDCWILNAEDALSITIE